MTQRIALLMAAALTAFLVVAGAALGASLARPAAPPATAPAPVTASDPLADPAVQAVLQDREASYRQLVEEANRRLEQANAQLQATPPPAPTAPSPPPPAAPAAPEPPISVVAASAIALSVAPGAQLTARPETVSFEGTLAYEVRLDQGLVYVDANTGRVLYNGATAPVTARASSPAVPAAPAAPRQDSEETNDDD